ncbi:tRNA(Ile)-lysidine synthetase, partial [candidate division KSB1 bacterium]|nr:tRNA(Ile)-lysidine synthetase [candidate division KSB1 bacterium]
MFKRFQFFITSNQLVYPESHIILAVSGGKDSMAMLHLFQKLAAPMNLTLSVAHINHGVRGAASDADEELVRSYCRDNQLDFVSRKLTD